MHGSAALLLTAFLLLPAKTGAQEVPFFEIGISLARVSAWQGSGVTSLKGSGGSVSELWEPYISFFLTPSLMLEPEFGFNLIDGELKRAHLGSKIGYLFAPDESGSLFGTLALKYAFQNLGYDLYNHDYELGVGLGYRWHFGEIFTIRMETDYRVIVNRPERTRLLFQLSLGGLIPKSK